MRVPEYPPILTGNTQQDSYNLREYIIRNIENMQRELTASGGTIYAEGDQVYITVNGNTQTLQEYIEQNYNVGGDNINITINATIQTGSSLQEKTVSVNENGDITIEPDENRDGMSKVYLHVAVPASSAYGTINIDENGTHDVTDYSSAVVNVQPDLQSKNVAINANGTQTITPDTGKDGLSSVTITVNVPSGSVSLQSKSVSPTSSQQTITPDTGYDGLSQVTVAGAPLETRTVTPTAAAQQIEKSSNSYYGLQRVNVNGDSNLTPGNIRKGVSIFGVAGTYDPSFSLQSKSVTPSGSAQTVVPDSGYDGLSQVSVAAIALQAKSVTPSASQQVITPGSSYSGLSKVTVAGDADLIASNIKKDINIFGVTGTYAPENVPINGSLIEITCSSNVDQVTATVNGHTYTAYKSGNKAYVTIPYSDTTSAKTCTLKGYSSGTQVVSNTVSMAAGVGYYASTLIATEYLYKDGVWYRVTNPTWNITSSDSEADVTVYSNRVVLRKGSQYSATYTLSPTFDMDGHTNFEIEYSISGGTFRTGTYGSYAKMSQGSYSTTVYLPTGTEVSHEAMTSTNGTSAFTTATLAFVLTLASGLYGDFTIHSIKLV